MQYKRKRSYDEFVLLKGFIVLDGMDFTFGIFVKKAYEFKIGLKNCHVHVDICL